MAVAPDARNPDLREALICGITLKDLDAVLVDDPEYAQMRGLDEGKRWETLKLQTHTYGGSAAAKSRDALMSQWRKGHAQHWVQRRLQSKVHTALSERAQKRLRDEWMGEQRAERRDARRQMFYLLRAERAQSMNHLERVPITAEQRARSEDRLDQRLQKKWDTVSDGLPFGVFSKGT